MGSDIVFTAVTPHLSGQCGPAGFGRGWLVKRDTRGAAVSPSAHPHLRSASPPDTGLARAGATCGQPSGADPGGARICDRICDRVSLGECDAGTFARITADMRRMYPRPADEDVVITYSCRRPGTVGGPFVSEVDVAVRAHSFSLFTLILPDVASALSGKEELSFAGAPAGAFGERMAAG